MKSCYEYAMDVLSKYPKTEKELRIKMYQHGYDSQMVMKTLEKLKVENFLNDKMFAESYLNSEVMRKGKPLFLVQQKLTMKGIDPKIIAELSNQFAEDIGFKKKLISTRKKVLMDLRLFRNWWERAIVWRILKK